MGKRSGFDKKQTKAVMSALDAATRKYGLPLVKHAATKWCNGQRDKARLLKQRAALEKQLAEVSTKLR
jgi:hypothetical protein